MKVTIRKALRSEKAITVMQKVIDNVPGSILREGVKFQFGDTPDTTELITDVTWLVESGEAVAWVNGVDDFHEKLEGNTAAHKTHGWEVVSSQEKPR